jgi:hypothetical protein
MRKNGYSLIFIFLLFVLFISVYPLNSYAIESLDPIISNTKTALTTETIPILAEPVTSEDSFVQLRLSFTNVEILDFIPSTFTATAACENKKTIYNNKLCVNISNDKGFKKGELLGKIVVKWGNITDEATIMRDDKNAYVSPSDTFYQSGLLFRYPIQNVDSAIIDTNSNASTNQTPIIVLLVLGIISVIAGAIIMNKQLKYNFLKMFRKPPTL